VQRVLTEAKAGRNTVDLAHVNAVQMEELHKEKVLQEVKSPYINDLIPTAVPPHREWVATFMNLVVLAYNTDRVKKEELPKTFQDLLDPKWKGRLGVEANDEEWFYAVIKEMGPEKGVKFFRDLVATNGLSVRTGHSLLHQMVISGDVPLALTVFGHMPMLAKQKGAHVDSLMLEPTVALSFGVGLAKKAPHPNAAILFYEYMITDGQKLLSQMNYVPTNKDTDSPFKKVPYKVMDKALFLNEYQKWADLFQDIILKAK
jgi:iron(III) transport system substrate-binding protein